MKVTLRDYQQEALNAFLAAGKGTLKIHPGGGKTIIGCAAIEALTLRKAGPPRVGLPAGLTGSGPFLTLVIVPTLELQDQWEGVLDAQGITNYAIETYAMAALRWKRGEENWFAAFDFIIFDEAHHLAEGVQWSRLLIPAFKAPYALGLTSTPPNDPENPLLRVLPILYERSFADGLDEGYAAPVQVRPIAVQLTELERKKYVEFSELINVAISRAGSLDRAFTAQCGVDEETGKPLYGGQVMTKRKMLVTLAEQKFIKLSDIVEGINAASDIPRRIFVWSEYIAALEQAQRVLTERGITSEFVHGEMPKKRRREVFQSWGTQFQVLLIAKIGEEGLDYPEVAHGIILAGAKTSRQNVQRIGRLLRPMPGKTAKLWAIFCERTMEERLIPLIDKVTEDG